MAVDDLHVLPDLPIAPIRWRVGEPRTTGTRPPLAVGHPATRLPCIGCQEPIGTEKSITLLVVGPGGDPDDQAKAARGGWHTATALIVHAACAAATTTTAQDQP